MDLHCIHCSERVEVTMATCRACGGDPWVRGDEEIIDLREVDEERDAADLLASLVAGYSEAAPYQRPRWGSNSSTALELELDPVRIGRFPAADDLLPAADPARARRSWRRT
jgi:hypothetical protein